MNENEIKHLISKISKNAHEKHRLCLYPGCKNISINSHLLQRNGILSNLSSSNFVFQSRNKNWLRFKYKDELEQSGIGSALTFLGFCNFHDTTTFRYIETVNPTFSDYKSHILLSYRAMCNEYRKKEILIDFHDRLLVSKTLNGYLDHGFITLSQKYLKEGRSDLKTYIDLLYSEINVPTNAFIFTEYEFDHFGFCTSSVFGPAEFDELGSHNTLITVALHIIPLKNRLKIIFGYHNSHIDDWTKNYINSFKGISRTELLQKLSDLVSARIETWCVSPEVYKAIPKEILIAYREFCENTMGDHSRSLNPQFNLFEKA